MKCLHIFAVKAKPRQNTKNRRVKNNKIEHYIMAKNCFNGVVDSVWFWRVYFSYWNVSLIAKNSIITSSLFYCQKSSVLFFCSSLFLHFVTIPFISVANFSVSVLYRPCIWAGRKRNLFLCFFFIARISLFDFVVMVVDLLLASCYNKIYCPTEK